MDFHLLDFDDIRTNLNFFDEFFCVPLTVDSRLNKIKKELLNIPFTENQIYIIIWEREIFLSFFRFQPEIQHLLDSVIDFAHLKQSLPETGHSL